MKPAGRDNFLPLRHLAAAMVIYGHAYALTRHTPGDVDLVQRFMPGYYAGSLAVLFFFAITPLAMFPLALAGAAIHAAVSWQGIEHPLLDRFKGKDSIVATSLPAL